VLVQIGVYSTNIQRVEQANIQRNSGSEAWRNREAATFVFGCILEGPSVSQLAQLVGTGLQFLLTATKDPSTQVRLTTMWTIGEIQVLTSLR